MATHPWAIARRVYSLRPDVNKKSQVESGDNSPSGHDTELELRKVGTGLQVVCDAERVMELVRVDKLECERDVAAGVRPGDVDV